MSGRADVPEREASSLADGERHKASRVAPLTDVRRSARCIVWLLRLIVLLALAPRAASACAVCGAADKTLAARGEEVPFAGRVRATLDGRAAAFAARHAPLRVVELRLVPGAAIALDEDVLLSAELPLLRRSLVSEGAAPRLTADRLMLGDFEARASYVGYRTRAHRLSFHGSAKAPTAPIDRDPSGGFVPTDLQPGCGSIVPAVGATYTVTGPLLTLWTSASFLMPVSVRGGPHGDFAPRVGGRRSSSRIASAGARRSTGASTRPATSTTKSIHAPAAPRCSSRRSSSRARWTTSSSASAQPSRSSRRREVTA